MKKFLIINHGMDHAQYFPGQGTMFTKFNHAFTGAGDTATAAYQDALMQVYIALDHADVLGLPDKPRGIRASDKVDHGEIKEENDINDELYWYVSILTE